MSGYLSLLLKAQAAGLIEPGTVTTCEVAHDDACPALTGGPCRCVPDVRLIANGRVVRLDDSGNALTVGRVA